MSHGIFSVNHKSKSIAASDEYDQCMTHSSATSKRPTEALFVNRGAQDIFLTADNLIAKMIKQALLKTCEAKLAKKAQNHKKC